MFLLPAVKGLPVQATMKRRWDRLPSLEVGSVVYRMGPGTPLAVWALASLPMLWLGVGWTGFIVGALGWSGTAFVAFSLRSTTVKVTAILIVCAGTVVLADLDPFGLDDH